MKIVIFFILLTLLLIACNINTNDDIQVIPVYSVQTNSIIFDEFIYTKSDFLLTNIDTIIVTLPHGADYTDIYFLVHYQNYTRLIHYIDTSSIKEVIKIPYLYSDTTLVSIDVYRKPIYK